MAAETCAAPSALAGENRQRVGFRRLGSSRGSRDSSVGPGLKGSKSSMGGSAKSRAKKSGDFKGRTSAGGPPERKKLGGGEEVAPAQVSSGGGLIGLNDGSLREVILAQSLRPGGVLFSSQDYGVELELQDGSLDSVFEVPVRISPRLRFLVCPSDESGSLCSDPADDAGLVEEWLAMPFISGPTGVTFRRDKPAKLRFFVGLVGEFGPKGRRPVRKSKSREGRRVVRSERADSIGRGVRSERGDSTGRGGRSERADSTGRATSRRAIEVLAKAEKFMVKENPWYEWVGLSFDGGGDCFATVEDIIAFNIDEEKLHPANETMLASVLVSFKRMLAVVNDSAVADEELMELVKFCVGITSCLVEAARLEALRRAMSKTIAEFTAEVNALGRFFQTCGVRMRWSCRRKEALTPRDRRAAEEHKTKLKEILGGVLTGLSAKSYVDSKGVRHKLAYASPPSLDSSPPSMSRQREGSGVSSSSRRSPPQRQRSTESSRSGRSPELGRAGQRSPPQRQRSTESSRSERSPEAVTVSRRSPPQRQRSTESSWSERSPERVGGRAPPERQLSTESYQSWRSPEPSITDGDIIKMVRSTYRPLTSPDGEHDWTVLGEYTVILRPGAEQREVWVETPLKHFNGYVANALKKEVPSVRDASKKGSKSYYFGDVPGSRQPQAQTDGRSTIKVRLGNATTETATFTSWPCISLADASSENGTQGSSGPNGSGGTSSAGNQGMLTVTGLTLPGEGQWMTTVIQSGEYRDCELPCDPARQKQMNVKVGVLQVGAGKGGTDGPAFLQVLDLNRLSQNRIMVLRQPRLAARSLYGKALWPCSGEEIFALERGSTGGTRSPVSTL